MNDRSDVQVGVIVEDCGLHIGKVLNIDHESGDMQIESMFTPDAGPRGCDVYHCGIVVQTPEMVEQKMKLFQDGGMEAIKKLWNERVAAEIY